MHIKIEDYNRLLKKIALFIRKAGPDNFAPLHDIDFRYIDSEKILREILDTEDKLYRWFEWSEDLENVSFKYIDIEPFLGDFFYRANEAQHYRDSIILRSEVSSHINRFNFKLLDKLFDKNNNR